MPIFGKVVEFGIQAVEMLIGGAAKEGAAAESAGAKMLADAAGFEKAARKDRAVLSGAEDVSTTGDPTLMHSKIRFTPGTNESPKAHYKNDENEIFVSSQRFDQLRGVSPKSTPRYLAEVQRALDEGGPVAHTKEFALPPIKDLTKSPVMAIPRDGRFPDLHPSRLALDHPGGHEVLARPLGPDDEVALDMRMFGHHKQVHQFDSRFPDEIDWSWGPIKAKPIADVPREPVTVIPRDANPLPPPNYTTMGYDSTHRIIGSADNTPKAKIRNAEEP